MAIPRNTSADLARLFGTGLMCSMLALGTAYAQETPAPAPEAAAPEAAAPEAAAPEAANADMTEGMQQAAEAAKKLAAGEDDEPVVNKAPKPDAHRVYVNDPAHFAAITQQFIVDGSSGEVLGMIDGGFLPNPVVASDGSLIAQASTVFERIARGKRTDYVEVFDPESLDPIADIELPDAPRFLVGTYPWMTSLTPDNKKLLFYRFSPSPAVGVVDLEGKKFDRMLDVPDCYHMFPTANDTFYMHCRDGSLAKVQFGAEGEPTITQSEVFHPEEDHLINHPAYSEKAKHLVWPTYTGKIYQIDLTGDAPKFLPTVEALTEEERADNWRLGGWQQVAYHRGTKQIFVLVDQRAEWMHKTPSRYVVVLNGETGERIQKIEMGHDIDSIEVSQDAEPLLYGLETGASTLHIYDAKDGKELRSVDQLGRGPQVITVHDLEP